MNGLLQGALRLATLLAFLAVVVWLGYRMLQRSEDRPALIVKWLLTLVDIGFVIFVVGPLFREFGYVAAFAGMPLAAFAGLVMALIWVPSITDAVGRKFGQLYDDGDRMPDPEPLFSIAEARRKQGRFVEAEDEVRRQLALFPGNFRAQMMLAEIQAVDRQDLAAASQTIHELIGQPGHTPKNMAYALTRLAEWQLRQADGRELARATFEQIVARLPDTPEAFTARQRLAHLTPPEMLAQRQERPKLAVPQSDDRLGLRGETLRIKPAGSDPQEEAAKLVAQLEAHPEDNQAREELAVLYWEGFQRADLAIEQLEQLIAQPFAPPAHVVKWLNVLADVQVAAGEITPARTAVQRILDLFPGTPAAENARRRLVLMDREVQGKRKSQVLKLGSYEQRIGLRDGPPKPPD